MHFTVYLRFATRASTPADVPVIRDFIGRAAFMLPNLSPSEALFRVISAQQPTLESIVLELDVTTNMTRPGELTDDDLHRFGIHNPALTRANAALQIWLARLRQQDGGPVQRTWIAYCHLTGRETGASPVYLLAAGARVAKIDSPAPSPPRKYDGSTEANA